MRIIKLDAIDSTNDFLKSMSNDQFLENFTVVTAQTQTNGKGQMGSQWVSETGKNLIMSILLKEVVPDIHQIYTLNIAVALAINLVLDDYNIPKLSIKWPNDIMSDDKKIGGILIENTIKKDGSIISIVGIGLNVNQTNFEHLPKASSLSVIKMIEFDTNELLHKIVKAVKFYMDHISNQETVDLWDLYNQKLFKKGIPMPFKIQNERPFMGIIKAVDPFGKLLLQLEDDSIQSFEIKAIQMLY